MVRCEKCGVETDNITDSLCQPCWSIKKAERDRFLDAKAQTLQSVYKIFEYLGEPFRLQPINEQLILADEVKAAVQNWDIQKCQRNIDEYQRILKLAEGFEDYYRTFIADFQGGNPLQPGWHTEEAFERRDREIESLWKVNQGDAKVAAVKNAIPLLKQTLGVIQSRLDFLLKEKETRTQALQNQAKKICKNAGDTVKNLTKISNEITQKMLKIAEPDTKLVEKGARLLNFYYDEASEWDKINEELHKFNNTAAFEFPDLIIDAEARRLMEKAR